MDKLARRPAAPIVPAGELEESVRNYASNVLAPRTRDAYRQQWGVFRTWAAGQRLSYLPAAEGTVVMYLAARADEGRRPSSLNQALSAIGWAHVTAGFPSPARTEQVKAIFAGIRRTLGTAALKKTPLLVPALTAAVQGLHGLAGKRDRALLLLGFSGAFRRSELVGLLREDLIFGEEGLLVRIQRSKTDQEGKGRSVAIPLGDYPETCPVAAVRTWLEDARIEKGPVFRAVTKSGRVRKEALTGRSVALIVKKCVAGVGINPANFSGHSLRSGLVTAAAKDGRSELAIAGQTGHKSMDTLRGYYRDAELFKNNAAKGLGL